MLSGGGVLNYDDIRTNVDETAFVYNKLTHSPEKRLQQENNDNPTGDRSFFEQVFKAAQSTPNIVVPKPKKITKRKSKGQQSSSYLEPADGIHREYHRPLLSYNELIVEALKNSDEGMLSLQQIYDYIQNTYEFFKYSNVAWQNSIRHNLSVQKMFERVSRPVTNPGKGGLWRIIPWILESIPKSAKKRKQEEASTTCVNSPRLEDLQNTQFSEMNYIRPGNSQQRVSDISYGNIYRPEVETMNSNYVSQKDHTYRQESCCQSDTRDIIGQSDTNDNHSYHHKETGSYRHEILNHNDNSYLQHHDKEVNYYQKEISHEDRTYHPKVQPNNLPLLIRPDTQKLNSIFRPEEDQTLYRQNSNGDIHSVHLPEILPHPINYKDALNKNIQNFELFQQNKPPTPKKRNHLMDTLAELALSVQHRNYDWPQKVVSPADEPFWNQSKMYPKSPFMYQQRCPDEVAQDKGPVLNPMLGGKTLLQATFSETDSVQLSD